MIPPCLSFLLGLVGGSFIHSFIHSLVSFFLSFFSTDVFSITNLLTKVYSESGLAPPLSERSWKSVEAGLAKAVGLSSLNSRTRLDDQVGVVTILRHPISHYLSYYAYYMEPDDPDKGLKR